MSKPNIKPRPACVDCKFHTNVVKGSLKWDRCSSPVWDYVQGKEVPRDELCYDMRAMGGECGKVGALYEAKQN